MAPPTTHQSTDAEGCGDPYAASAGVVALAGLPGDRRRFTGSYDSGSFDPAAMPTTIWLDDDVPGIDPELWRLTIVDRSGRYELSRPGLAAFDTRLRATLDCTSGRLVAPGRRGSGGSSGWTASSCGPSRGGGSDRSR